MDLWKAGAPELTPTSQPSSDAPSAADNNTAGSVEFSITWDRFRLFRASTHEEAVRWVGAIRAVQAARPMPQQQQQVQDYNSSSSNVPPTSAREGPAYTLPGGGPQSPMDVEQGGGGGGTVDDWGAKSSAGGGGKRRKGDGDRDGGGICGGCVVM